jgi:methyl-accepting chemotaxis protein
MSAQGNIQQRPRTSGVPIGPRTILAVLIIALAAGSSIWLLRQAALVPASIPQEEIDAAARNVTDFIQPGIDATIDLGRVVEKAKAAGSDREIIRGLAVPTLQMSPENLGVSVVFEPDGFDGKDAQYAGMGEENDESGRFAPYYYVVGDGEVLTDHLTMTIEAGIESWYLAPLRSKKPRLLQPFYYPINGKDTLLSTISVPVITDGKAFGVAVLDVMLSKLQSDLQALKPGGKGIVALLSDAGTWIAHPDPSHIGKEIAETGAAPADAFDDREAGIAYAGYVSAHPRVSLTHLVEATGERYVMVPVTFASVEEGWTLIVRLPPAGITPEMKDALMVSLGIAFVAALCLAILTASYRAGAVADRPGAPSVAVAANARRKQPTIVRR